MAKTLPRAVAPLAALLAALLPLVACSLGAEKDEQDEQPDETAAEAAVGEDGEPLPPAGPLPIVPADIPGLPSSFVIGDVILSGQPTPEGLVNVRDSGTTLVINTRMQSEMSFDERSVVQGLGMRYLNLGFTPSTLEDTVVESFIFELAKHKPEDGKLLVHCSSGGRVAALWAMYEIKALKVDPQTAVERARKIAPLSTELVIYIGDYARRIGAL